jgi:hypothetical protein
MPLEPWYKVALPRAEVREGRSFNPDEFAIALEQVVSGRAPEDYRDPAQFFGRTYFTRALVDHCARVLRRLAGSTENAPPVLTLITQFGGGKTHTLTALYHLANAGSGASAYPGVAAVLKEAGLSEAPKAKVGVFVGNAWDPQPGRETPWIDLARQIAGDAGVAALGPNAKISPPGTDSLNRVIDLAGGPVLFLFDEVLNALTRHKNLAEPMHAFIHNVMRGFIGQKGRAAVISLPRSQVEMTPYDQLWQDKITKVVGAVAQQLIANDEAEISEVVRRRLFENLGKDSTRKAVAKAYADWCFERRAQLPPEVTARDASSEATIRESLRDRFERCYPFHPATLTVFQRKWSTVPQFQQTRGTLAMLAQWISWAYRDGYQRARREALITLGSAPLQVPEFRGSILGQLGEQKLVFAIEADVIGELSHARALDPDTAKEPLKDLHRRVGAAVLFESSGGQTDKAAHLPELRFALGEPDLDTTSIDNAVAALERRGYYIRSIGSDGYRFGFTPRLKKVVADRKASLDEGEIRKAMKDIVKAEFEKRKVLAVQYPADGSEVGDTTQLTLLVLEPDRPWEDGDALRATLAEWTTKRGKSDRLYPGALLWAAAKPGRDLRERVEQSLAWRKVAQELSSGTLAGDWDPAERKDVAVTVRDAEDAAHDEVWASYRFLILADRSQPDGIAVIDLGAGHSSATESLSGRIVTALRSNALLNESPGAGYLDRRWPEAFKASGAWPLKSLRQAFLSGAMERLLDVDAYLRAKIPEFVRRGDFGLASGADPGGTYQHLWFDEEVGADEVNVDTDVYLLTKSKAKVLKRSAVGAGSAVDVAATPPPVAPNEPATPVAEPSPVGANAGPVNLRLVGDVPFESWNRIGTKLLSKLKAAGTLTLSLDAKVSLDGPQAAALRRELAAALQELGIEDRFRIE